MSFVDPAFLFCFFPIALLLFFAAGRLFGPRGAHVVLIFATLIFCAPYEATFVCFITLSAALNYVASCIVFQSPDSKPRSYRSYVFVGALIFNLAILFVVKFGFLFSAIPMVAQIVAASLAALPATISFLTFQRSVALAHAHQQQPDVRPLARFGWSEGLRFGAFSLMFPNLLIGPIAYVSEVGPQLGRAGFGRFRRLDLEVGATLLVIGLAKKLLIADPLDVNIVSPFFGAVSAGQKLVPIETAMAMLGYYAQLYFDFSGYSDMALGLARCFGLRLPVNFDSPLRATGIIDFWKRWHITLTRVIVTFVFTPLSLMGARWVLSKDVQGWKARAVSFWLPLFVNFQVIALWHGAKLTFVFFGIFHAVWFIVESEVRATARWKSYVKATSNHWRRIIGQIITFAPMMISFTIFRCNSLTDFSSVVASLFGDWLAVLSSAQDRVLNTRQPVMYLAAAFAIILLAPNAYEFLRKYRPGIYEYNVVSTSPRIFRFAWRPSLIWSMLIGSMALLVVNSLGRTSAFIYGGF